ncbi:MAG TPA: hypothetical protein VEL70_00820 [Candidatus Acidoferrum sp.]|nr:hypothetical protein [Candidatus Acidoferrum sp.]
MTPISLNSTGSLIPSQNMHLYVLVREILESSDKTEKSEPPEVNMTRDSTIIMQ